MQNGIKILGQYTPVTDSIIPEINQPPFLVGADDGCCLSKLNIQYPLSP